MSSGFRPDVAVVIAHPSEAGREALIRAVSVPSSGVIVAGAAAAGGPALALARRVAPDVALVAATLPGIDGVGLTKMLRAELPCCRVILLADSDDDHTRGALAAGAAGAIIGPRPEATALTVVRGAMRNEGFVPPSWASSMLDHRRAIGDVDRAVLQGLADARAIDDVASELRLTRHLVGRRAGDALVRVRRDR